ncbi:MAG: hypothetical protein ABSG06_06455 [Methanoregula sp.]|jgi:hypothetical protein
MQNNIIFIFLITGILVAGCISDNGQSVATIVTAPPNTTVTTAPLPTTIKQGYYYNAATGGYTEVTALPTLTTPIVWPTCDAEQIQERSFYYSNVNRYACQNGGENTSQCKNTPPDLQCIVPNTTESQ